MSIVKVGVVVVALSVSTLAAGCGGHRRGAYNCDGAKVAAGAAASVAPSTAPAAAAPAAPAPSPAPAPTPAPAEPSPN